MTQCEMPGSPAVNVEDFGIVELTLVEIAGRPQQKDSRAGGYDSVG